MPCRGHGTFLKSGGDTLDAAGWPAVTVVEDEFRNDDFGGLRPDCRNEDGRSGILMQSLMPTRMGRTPSRSRGLRASDESKTFFLAVLEKTVMNAPITP